MFNVIAISGSPRKGGNTELLINAAITPFISDGHAIHKFFLSANTVEPCIACDECKEEGVCVIQDDMHRLLQTLTICDAIIIGSPVFNRNISAQLLAVFNRFHCITHTRPFRDRIVFGGAIAVGGASNSQGITLNVIHNFLLSLGVCCVPAVLNGVSVVAREKGAVLSQPKSLQDARVLGENILRALKMRINRSQ